LEGSGRAIIDILSQNFPGRIVENHIIEQVNSSNYLGYSITETNDKDLEIKMSRFNKTCSTIRTLNNKTRKEIQIKF
jgi:hypothetical protein